MHVYNFVQAVYYPFYADFSGYEGGEAGFGLPLCPPDQRDEKNNLAYGFEKTFFRGFPKSIIRRGKNTLA